MKIDETASGTAGARGMTGGRWARQVAAYEPRDEDRKTRGTRRREIARQLRAGEPARHSRLVPRDDGVGEQGEVGGVADAAGEARPWALRRRLRLRVDTHRATSRILRVAYPFLAEGGLGSNGTYIGADVFSGGSFVYDPWVLYEQRVLTNPNMLFAGVIGTGKSSTAKALAIRSIALGRKVYVPSDPKGEWASIATAVGGATIRLGPGMATRLNPLDAGAKPAATNPRAWERIVWSRRRALLGTLTESMLARPMESVEHSALDVALGTASSTSHIGNSNVSDRNDCGEPTLPHVVAALFEPDHAHARDAGLDVGTLAVDGRHIAHALRRLVRGDLAGMFDGPSTTRFDPSLPMVSLDSSRIGAGGNDHALRLALACASAWMEAAITDTSTHPSGEPSTEPRTESQGGQRYVIYDEGWRVMRDPALLRRMQEQWKLSRAWGIANILIIHRLSDLAAVGDQGSEARALAEGLLADCSTRVLLRQESDQLAKTAALLGLTDVEIATIANLPKGRALWRLPERSFIVQLVRHAREVELFDTDTNMQ